jgi:hypothetical protein
VAKPLLAEAVPDRPQRRLADEGGAVDARKGPEPAIPVAAAVVVEALVGVDAPELADAFDGQDLTVS